MNIVVTGSLGNISKPLAAALVNKGHSVTIISSNPAKEKDIEALGARAAIGSIADADFLTAAFTGADAAYCMIPLSFTVPDLAGYLRKMADNYVLALRQAGIKKIVVLSGWAANLLKNENVESTFSNLPGASVTIMRPAAFYSNFYNYIDMIKGKGLAGKFLTLRYCGLWALLTGKTGLLMGNYGGNDRIVFVSPRDIADAVAEELLAPPAASTSIRYVGSEEMTCNEAARIIGTAVGKPYLKWVLISDKQMLQGLKMAKMPPQLAQDIVEMQAVMHSGAPLQQFHKHQPKMGKVKLKDFAKEFAEAYHKKS